MVHEKKKNQRPHPLQAFYFYLNEFDLCHFSCWWIYRSVDIVWRTFKVTDTSKYWSWDLNTSRLLGHCYVHKHNFFFFIWKQFKNSVHLLWDAFPLNIANTNAIAGSLTWYLTLFSPGIQDFSLNHGSESFIHFEKRGCWCSLYSDAELEVKWKQPLSL